MDPSTYQRIGGGAKTGTRRRSHGYASRGFRLNSKKFSVSKLRARFMCLLRMLNSWRCSYSRTLQSLKKGVRKTGRLKPANTSSSSKSFAPDFPIVVDRGDCKLRSFRRSNSFYAEAIADCLDFIKRSSIISVDQTTQGQPKNIEFHDSSA